MAVYRAGSKCPKCGMGYNGIYRDNDGTFIGDDFIKWDIEGHVCTSAKSVEVEEAKSEKLPEYKFRKFKITGLTPDAYVELNNEEIKNINGMIPCLASRLVDYPYMFVMPDGKSCHSDWLLFETFESEQQGNEGELREENERLNAFIKKIANITALTISNEGINLRSVIEMAQNFRKEALKEKES